MKWIIQVTMPNQAKYALSSHEGHLALIEIDPKTGTARDVWYYDSVDDAREKVDDLLKQPLAQELFARVKIDFVEVVVAS